MFRIIANILLFISILYLPWWVVVIVGIVFLFVFSSFYEIIIWGLVGDVLYGTQIASLFQTQLLLTLGALVLFVMVHILKKHIRFYNE